MTNLMLSWQQAALVALGSGVAGVALVYAGRIRHMSSRVGPFLREAGVVVGLYALWQLAGSLATGGFPNAVAHAWWIWDAERTLRLPGELDVQRLILGNPLLCQIANLYYATMHFGMLIAMLVWLFIRHRDDYPAVRNAMAASTAICLVISFIPVAPPRMLTGTGITDLAAQYGQSVYGAVGSTAGADQLSAMPSVHVAWSVLVAWAVITRARSRWRWLIVLHPATTVFVVVATGNHYWADGIVALAIVAAVISAQAALARPLRLARVARQAEEPVSPTASTLARGSDGQVGLDPLQVVTGKRQVRLAPVEHEVEEHVVRPVGVLQQPDQVILRVEGDEDVLDRVVEAERLDRTHLGPDHFGVASGGQLQVKVLAAAQRPEGHPAVPVDERGPGRALNAHCFLKACFDVHALSPLLCGWLLRQHPASERN